jgi:hypothetical protein
MRARKRRRRRRRRSSAHYEPARPRSHAALNPSSDRRDDDTPSISHRYVGTSGRAGARVAVHKARPKRALGVARAVSPPLFGSSTPAGPQQGRRMTRPEGRDQICYLARAWRGVCAKRRDETCAESDERVAMPRGKKPNTSDTKHYALLG